LALDGVLVIGSDAASRDGLAAIRFDIHSAMEIRSFLLDIRSPIPEPSIEWGMDIPDGWATTANYIDGGVRVSGFSFGERLQPGTSNLFTLHYTVPSDYDRDQAGVVAVEADIRDSDNNKSALSISHGRIFVHPLNGDLNGDGRIDIRDVVMLMQRIVS